MKFFDTYTSNTTAAGGNQHFFESDGAPHTGRAFYKITAGGKYNYSLLFSNITDSTFADGKTSHNNIVLPSWEILSARVGKCGGNVFGEDLSDAAGINEAVTDIRTVMFGGKEEKSVAPGEFFACDPFEMEFFTGDYLCFEITFAGTAMPYHEESQLPLFAKTESGWIYDRRMPIPGMVGCDRKVKARIGYLGDSITQGIGTVSNSYTHWNAVLADIIGTDYAHWNLGLGFARANDTGSDGAWLYKAKHNDIAVVCIGANDIMQGLPEDKIKKDLETTADKLSREGRTVILQTIPPFEYSPVCIPVWEHLNRFIKEELAGRVAAVFDVGECIGEPNSTHTPRFGGHPNADGCKLWAEGLYKIVSTVMDK